MITGKVKTMYEDAEKTKAIFPRTHAKAVTDLIDTIYPVGSIYMNINYHHPADLFGGTWELISGRFLVGHGSNGIDLEVMAGSTGGSSMHTHDMSTGYGLMSSSGASLLWQYKGTDTYAVNWKMVGSYTDSFDGTCGDGMCLAGNTSATSTLPPYLAVYMWKRTA